MPVEMDSEYYKMNHTRRGMAIIFNHENFNSWFLKPRDGTNVDCDNLKRTMQGLGFEVTVHCNNKREELIKIVDEG
jgi:caspase-like apoptosis-related cysteine protease